MGLKQIRIERGLSATDLCRRARTSAHSIAKLESGQRVRLDAMWRIARALGVDVSEIDPEAKPADDDLAYLINRWSRLPARIKLEIVALVEEHENEGQA